MLFLENDFCDESFQPPLFLPCYSTIDMVGGSLHDSHLHSIYSYFKPMVFSKGFQLQTLVRENFFLSLDLV
jgi:hypothetical protein